RYVANLEIPRPVTLLNRRSADRVAGMWTVARSGTRARAEELALTRIPDLTPLPTSLCLVVGRLICFIFRRRRRRRGRFGLRLGSFGILNMELKSMGIRSEISDYLSLT